MGWLIKEKRGPSWKHDWGDQTVASLSPPPMPLVALFLIMLVLLWMLLSVDYNRQLYHTMVGMKMLILFLPVLLFILVRWVSINGGRFVVPLPGTEQDSVARAGSTPWGVAILLALLLVMLYYQSGEKFLPATGAGKYFSSPGFTPSGLHRDHIRSLSTWSLTR